MMGRKVNKMPVISKIRLTNIKYEDDNKRINDEVYYFDGHNGAILLENGGGKTVLIHTILQAVLPHTKLGERKIRDTLQLENSPAHIGIEWIISDHPRRYVTTAVSLFIQNNALQSYRYVFEYEEGHKERLENMPFAIKGSNGNISGRPAYKEEIADYFQMMKQKTSNAQTFDTLSHFHDYIENNFQIIHSEWKSIVKINGDEGGIEQFFEHCKTTTDLYDRLLIPIVEDSIERYEKRMFADLFEQQREGFQAYLNFKKSIEEHEAIQRELESYVKEFALFDNLNSRYETIRRKAKGLYETIAEQEFFIYMELEKIEKSFEKWFTREHHLQIKHISYEILRKKEKQTDLQSQFNAKQGLFHGVENDLKQLKQQFYSLQHAKLVKEQNTIEQFLDSYKQELAEYDKKHDVSFYEAALEEESAKLHGYFIEKTEKVEKEINNLKLEIMPFDQLIEQLAVRKTAEKKRLRQQERSLDEMTGAINTNNDTLKRLDQQLLAKPDQENVADKLTEWTESYESYDQKIIQLKERDKQYNKNLNDLSEEKLANELKQTDIKLHLQKTQYNINAIDEEHQKLVNELGTIRKNWQSVDLYLRHDSIYHSLINLQNSLITEKDRYLYEERLAYRFIDDYDNQETFFADSFITKKVANWQKDFYVDIGTNYYNDLPEAEKDLYSDYPLWSLTLVTTDLKKATVMSWVTEQTDHLQFPIIVLSVDEIKQMRDFEQLKWIVPSHWKFNMNDEQFNDWKENVHKIADEITDKRKNKEAELQKLAHVIEQFEQFFKRYPKEDKEQLRKELIEQKKQQIEIDRTLEVLNEKIHEEKRAISKMNKLIKESEENLIRYEQLIRQAQEYVRIENHVNKLNEQCKVLEKEITLLKGKVSRIKIEITETKEERQFMIDRQAEMKQQLTFVSMNSLYNEVKTYRPVFTKEAKEVIEKRREELQKTIAGIRQSYDALNIRIEYESNRLSERQQEIQQLRKNHILDEQMSFPVDGDHLIEQASQMIEQKERKKESLRLEVSSIETKLDRQIGRVEFKEDDFKKHYPNETLHEFSIPLNEVENELKEEQELLTNRKQYLDREKNRLTKEKEDIVKANNELEKYMIKHQFNSTLIEAILLSEEEKSEFSYNRQHHVRKIINELTKTNDARIDGENQLSNSRQSFQRFCREHISDYDMRNRALEGIEQQKTYDDILTFQEKMIRKIENANLYARNYIRDKDKEVQAFIDNLHNHLVNVTDQLRTIPRKTRVTVDDKRKDVFSFTIPDWQEEEGKRNISNHLDWILEQLELDYYKDAQGLEDDKKVREQIEVWLDTRQLLQVVMKEKPMKVLCRKVTNDNRVTNRLTSWEQSNKWSGGEKWSKNMTLFLGILNYVAEKKQFNANVKRQQAVILDNPFGIASSEHVLSPVFFIAEQLGFQIIALTAHADGKYIQDYFPVNYSCRLRPTADGKRQVMEKKKTLHHAYFHDHEAQSLIRLGEQEQLSLL